MEKLCYYCKHLNLSEGAKAGAFGYGLCDKDTSRAYFRGHPAPCYRDQFEPLPQEAIQKRLDWRASLTVEKRAALERKYLRRKKG